MMPGPTKLAGRKGTRKEVSVRRLLSLIPLLFALALALPASRPGAAPLAGDYPATHVFTIVLENEGASTTFGPGSPAPYLAQTLTSEGAFLPKYYGVGHSSATTTTSR